MPLYPYESQLVLDGDNPALVAFGSNVTIYDPNDVNQISPLTLVDTSGLPLSNPIPVSSQGFTPAFQATLPQVMWAGDGAVGYMSSYKGLLDQATSSSSSASSSAASAAAAAADAEDARIDAEAARIAAELAASGSGGGGTGDVVRARLPLNVKDYGAVGNGTTDDTTAIQSALDAVPEGGRAVYIPAGRYKISSTLRIKRDGTQLYGDGTGNKIGATQISNGSRLEPTSAVTGQVLLVQRTEDDRPLQGVILRDFTIEGQLLGTAVTGIKFRSNQGHMERVHIWKMSGIGLQVTGYPEPFVWDTYDSTFHNLQIAQCAGTGVILDSDSADTHWSHCVIYDNQDNLIVKGASAQFTGCHFYSPIRHNIWFNGGGSRTKFANCKIEGLKNHMVNIDSTLGGYSDIQFTGCGFSSTTSGIPDNTYDYVNISGPSSNGISRTTFVGNSFTLKGGSTLKPRHAISLNGNAVQGTVILSNSFGPATQWGTSAVLNSGSSSTPAVIKSNANVADQGGGSTPYINVADYGATGNGTDQTAAIQAALNAVPATGATVWMPPGNYKVTAPLVIGTDNTTLRGSGAGARAGSFTGQGTTIVAGIGVAFTGPVVNIARPDASRAVYAPKLVDLAIDASGVTTSASGPVDALSVTAIRGDFDNLAIWSATGSNLRVVGLSSSIVSTGNRFRSIVASNATGNGITVDSNAPDNSFNNCVAESNAKGIQLIGNRTHVVGCDFNGNTTNVYITDGGTSTRFTASKFRFAVNHGVELVTVASGIADVSFTGCSFEGNGSAATNTYDHLNAGGSTSFAVSRLAIVGCAFVSSATNKPRYGVNFASSAVQNAQVVGNVFGSSTHFGTAAYNNGSNSTLKHQVIGNTNVPDITNTSAVTADYTLVASDANTNVDANSGAPMTITVPTNATAAMPIGTRIRVTQLGVGQVTVAAASGVTLNTAGTLTGTQYSVLELRKRSTDAWVVAGVNGTPAAHTHVATTDLTATGTKNSTTFLRGDNTWAVPSGGGSGVQRFPFLVVASADASADVKSSADYVCDGTNDEVEINLAALRAAPLASRNTTMSGTAEQLGKVMLTGGRFNIGGSSGIKLPTGVHLQGQGWLTELRAVSCTAAGVINLNNVNDHLVMVSDLYLQGNSSSGGSCNGINFDMTGSTNDGTTGVGAYPSSSPDSYLHVHDLFIDNFEGGTRTGIYMGAASTANNRGNIIDRIQMRNISGDGIRLSSASDSFIANCHIGTIAGSGIRIETGNVKINNCKTFYCDTYGLYITSGRGTLAGYESQDDFNSLFVDAGPWALAGVTLDTFSGHGLRIGADNVSVTGLSIFNRSGGRYATSGNAIVVDAGSDDVTVLGSIQASNITTSVSGSWGLRNFVRVPNGSSIISAGG